MAETKGKSASFTAVFGLLLLLVLLLSGCSAETEETSTGTKCSAFTSEPAGWQQARLINILADPDKSALAVAWSSNGRLAVASWKVYVYNKELCLIKALRIGAGMLVDVAWSPDGRLAVLSSYSVSLYNENLDLLETFGVGLGDLTSLEWSQDGRLAVSSNDNRVYVYTQAELNEKAPTLLWDSSRDISEISWSSNGWLAAATDNKTILIYNQDLQLEKILQEPTDWVTRVAWAADGRLAAGSIDQNVYVYDKELKLITLLSGSGGVPSSLSWSGDGRLAVGRDDKVFTYDKELQQENVFVKSTSKIKSVAWFTSPEGRWRLAAGATAQTWYTDDSGDCGDGCKVFIYEEGA